MFNRAFSEEDSSDGKADPADDTSPMDGDTSDASREPEYSFAGFNIDFSEKIQLTPPSL
jgi:hypothetical protein